MLRFALPLAVLATTACGPAAPAGSNTRSSLPQHEGVLEESLATYVGALLLVGFSGIAVGNDLLVFSMNGAAHGAAVGYEEIDRLPERATEAARQALADGRLTAAQLNA